MYFFYYFMCWAKKNPKITFAKRLNCQSSINGLTFNGLTLNGLTYIHTNKYINGYRWDYDLKQQKRKTKTKKKYKDSSHFYCCCSILSFFFIHLVHINFHGFCQPCRQNSHQFNLSENLERRISMNYQFYRLIDDSVKLKFALCAPPSSPLCAWNIKLIAPVYTIYC